MNINSNKKTAGPERWKRLLPPIFLFLFSLAALINLPRENYLFPRPLNYKSHYENFYNRDLPYVTVTVPELSYTGLSCGENSSYYYTLSDGFCQFYLLSGESETYAVPLLTDISLKGRLIRLEDEEYRQLLTMIAEELPWTVSSLEERTAPYAVSTQPYPVITRQFGRLFFLGCLLFSLRDLILLLYRQKPRSGFPPAADTQE